MGKTLFFWLLLLTKSQLINKKFAKRTGTGLGLIPVQLKREILLSRSLLRKMPQTKNSGNSHLVFDCYFQSLFSSFFREMACPDSTKFQTRAPIE